MENQPCENTEASAEPTGRATYCPEDNKLRLYVGRVPRDEYLKLRAEGWTALHKQREAGGGDFVAIWTPDRRDTALDYAGIIEDEDMGPAERAADRAERFAGYREKRTTEAIGRADTFDAGPTVHGFQSQARAERSAARHDRVAARACDAWSKAEYWQSRTAGVISHRLHLSSPSVRMGRIKELEAALRKVQASQLETVKWLERWSKPGLTLEEATHLANYDHCHIPRKAGDREDFKHSPSAYDGLTNSHPTLYAPRTLEEVIDAVKAAHSACLPGIEDWIVHYSNRLAYETQMIEAQGGRAAMVEMQVGGWIGQRQIRKVNKSPETGRVVSVTLKCRGSRYDSGASGFCMIPYNIERLPADAYRAPSAEDLAALESEKKAEKAAKPKTESVPLINPTEADALRLQEIWNSDLKRRGWLHSGEEQPGVARITQAQYSANSGGSYSKCETIEVEGGAKRKSQHGYMRTRELPVVAKFRTLGRRVVILTDKPQKAIPSNVWRDPRPEMREELESQFAELEAATRANWLPESGTPERELLEQGAVCGLVYISSQSQFGFSEEGKAWAKEQRELAAL